MAAWLTDAPFSKRSRTVASWPSWQAAHKGVHPFAAARSILGASFCRGRCATDSRPWKEARQGNGERPALSVQFARLPSRRKIRAALRASPALQAARRASAVAACGISPRAVEWDDRISSQLRPPLSGCDFAGELCQERLLVQVQMQVLVMLPPQVLLRCAATVSRGVGIAVKRRGNDELVAHKIKKSVVS